MNPSGEVVAGRPQGRLSHVMPADGIGSHGAFPRGRGGTQLGIPPPTLTVEKTTVSGWTRSGTRKDVSLGGGGALDYAHVRDGGETAGAAAGWSFQLDGGRIP